MEARQGRSPGFRVHNNTVDIVSFKGRVSCGRYSLPSSTSTIWNKIILVLGPRHFYRAMLTQDRLRDMQNCIDGV